MCRSDGMKAASLQEFAAASAAPVESDLALGRLQAGERAHQFGLAVALDAGDADDLAARDVEADIPEFLAADRPDAED